MSTRRNRTAAAVWTIAIALAVASCAPAPAVVATTPSAVVSTPEAAARAWLALVDGGDWDAAYAQMIPMFRSSVSMADWRSTIERARATSPPGTQRELVQTVQGTTMFPDAIQLTFRGGTGVHETVTVVREGDGWGVAGYGLQPAR